MSYSLCKTLINRRDAKTSIRLITLKSRNFLGSTLLLSSRFRCICGNATKEDSYAVQFFVNSCGLSPESALEASSRLKFVLKNYKNPESVISLLKKHNFSQAQIRNLVKRCPELLCYNPERTLLPKFDFFYAKGFSSADLGRILSLNPWLLRQSLHSCIIPNYDRFKNLVNGNEENVLLGLKRFPYLLDNQLESCVVPNFVILQEHGVPKENIVNHIMQHPRIFFRSHDSFRRAVEEATIMGFNPSSNSFLSAVRALIQISKVTWKRKVDAYKNWGWSEEDIVSAFRRNPYVMMVSVGKVMSMLDFLVNKMGWERMKIASHPIIFTLSLKKRIIPRSSVLQHLFLRGLIKSDSNVQSLLISEEKFLQKFVCPYKDEASYLLKLYQEKLALSIRAAD